MDNELDDELDEEDVMELHHAFTVPVPVDDAWRALLDIERVAPCLPGANVEEYDGKTVVAVCHAGVIMASLKVLLGIPHGATGARLQPSNTGLTEWEHDRNRQRWTLHAFNEATHLLSLHSNS